MNGSTPENPLFKSIMIMLCEFGEAHDGYSCETREWEGVHED